jgi:ATP-dependent RNA helicase DDX21
MLHGDVRQYDRERIYRDFKSGHVRRVVATNVAARGLDFPEIELVVQIEPPREVEAYVHRAGRTGRAGRNGVSVVLVQSRQLSRLTAIERVAGFKFEELTHREVHE